MSADLSALQARLASLHNRSEIAGRADELFYINAAQKMLQRLGFFKGQDTETTLQSPAISSGATGVMSIALPSDYRAYDSIVQTAPSYLSGFGIADIKKMNELYRSRSTLADTVFQAIRATKTNIYLYPPYTASATYAAA